MRFNAPVHIDEVGYHCGYLSEGREIEVEATRTGDNQPGPSSSSEYLINPHEPLEFSRDWTFRCAPGLKPLNSEGILSQTASREGQVTFRTFGAMALERFSALNKRDVDPDHAQLVLEFSNPLHEGAGELIDISPPPKGPYRWEIDGVYLVGTPEQGLPAGTTFEVTWRKGLKDVFGQPLSPPPPMGFTTATSEPRLNIEPGPRVIAPGSPVRLGEGRNLNHVDIQVAEVSKDALFGLLNQIDWWDDQPSTSSRWASLLSKRDTPSRFQSITGRTSDCQVTYCQKVNLHT